MTPKEALEILYKGIAPNPTANNECIRLCKSALEKQIPKKLRVDDEGWLCCPKCDETFKLHNQYHEQNRYCGNCGQRIDWSEVNAKKGVIPNDR